MVELHGEYASAKIFTVDDATQAIDAHALAQIQMLCNTEACEGSKIRVMPDVHAGNVGPIGLTMTLPLKIMPVLIGNDIGCGVMQVESVKSLPIDFTKLDKEIRKRVPAGSLIHSDISSRVESFGRTFLKLLHCYEHIQEDRALRSLCSLGGGNHFIEMERNDLTGAITLTVHSGSRNLGQQVFDWYMKAGQKKLKASGMEAPYEMTWLEGDLMGEYLDDVRTVCEYAKMNRKFILFEIMKAMKWKKLFRLEEDELLDCPHNFVGNDGILRKGAISAHEGERLLIPVSMRDGILKGVGKGNPDWNYSAPHGSGRLFKRSDVASNHTVSEFKRAMKGVWCSCVDATTLGESPFAYRSVEQIRASLSETAELDGDGVALKPVYSFKSCEVKK